MNEGLAGMGIFLLAACPDGSGDDQHDNNHKAKADGAFQKDRHVAPANAEGLAQPFFNHGPEDDPEHQPDNRKPESPSEITEDAGSQSDPNIRHGITDGIGPDEAEHQDRSAKHDWMNLRQTRDMAGEE